MPNFCLKVPTGGGKTLLATLYSRKTKEDLWIVPLDGGAPRPWIVTDGAETTMSFSPDGQWIYVTQTTDSTGIWRVRTDGSSIEKTAAQWPGAASPSPAPTGDRVAYQKQGALAILDLPSDTTAILPVPGQYPRWSPTGE